MNKLSILVAEDCDPDVFLVRKALQDAGLEHELFLVEDAASVDGLLERVGRDIPALDLALVDLNLPKADGTELIRMIRQSACCGGTPVIVMTSSESPADRAKAAELGISVYFNKPSTLEEFMRLGQVIRTVVENDSPGGLIAQ